MLNPREIWNAARVRRFHVQPMIGEQTVADHSWGVAMIVGQIAEGYFNARLLTAALVHDLAENATGDTPAPAKWRWPKLATALIECEAEANTRLGVFDFLHSLSAKERDILKWADLFELLQFATHQELLGNSYFARMRRTVYNLLAESTPTDSAKLLLQEYVDGSE